LFLCPTAAQNELKKMHGLPAASSWHLLVPVFS
jgi:hypothetical protein